MRLRDIEELIKSTYRDWDQDNALRIGASLSFYAVLSLAPLIVIATAIAAWFFGPQAATGQLSAQLRSSIGDNGAKAIEGLVASASQQHNGAVATLIGLAVLLIGASGVFAELQSALNVIWKVKPRPGSGLAGTLRQRAVAILMVLCTGVFLICAIAASSIINAASQRLAGSQTFWHVVNYGASFVIISGMFMLLYKYVPDVKVSWRDTLIGAAVTGALFILGQWFVGLYIGRSGLASAYGAGGALVVVMLWVFYVSQAFLFGAEFTQVYARCWGSGVAAGANAVAIEAEECASQADDQKRSAFRGSATASRETQPPIPPEPSPLPTKRMDIENRSS